MTDKTVFVNTAYMDDGSETEFLDGILDAYHAFIRNKLEHLAKVEHAEDPEWLESQVKRLDKFSSFEMLLNSIANMFSFVGTGFTLPSGFLRMFELRMKAMEMENHLAIYIIDHVLQHLSEHGDLKDIKSLGEKIRDNMDVSLLPENVEKLDQAVKHILNIAEFIPDAGPMIRHKVFQLDTGNPDEFERLQQLIATAEADGSNHIDWQNEKVPVVVAKVALEAATTQFQGNQPLN